MFEDLYKTDLTNDISSTKCLETSKNLSLNSKAEISIDNSESITSCLPDNLSKYIKVVCRIRPLNMKEKQINTEKTIIISSDKNDSIIFKNKIFKFDHVIPETASQLYLYEKIAKPIISDVLNGFNGTIFAYGQTSSGKTFTMEGILGQDELEGIIPRLSRDIFKHIEFQRNNSNFITKVSSFQLYMEKIQDMLNENSINLSIHEDAKKDFYVKNLTFRKVNSADEMLHEFRKSQINRKTCATEMNEVSSRSHSIFQIEVKQENIETGIVLTGKLFLVDLAGSETVSKTHAEGIVVREAYEINKSLFELKKVIKSISKNNQETFIYRNSKLTKILKESLGGNSLTTMIICCSPSIYNENETEKTLRFGSMAKRIKNQVKINEELTVEKLKLKHENNQLIIKRLESKLNKILSTQQKNGNSQLMNRCYDDNIICDKQSSVKTIDKTFKPPMINEGHLDKENFLTCKYKSIIENIIKNVLKLEDESLPSFEWNMEDINQKFGERLNHMKDRILKDKVQKNVVEKCKEMSDKNNEINLLHQKNQMKYNDIYLKNRNLKEKLENLKLQEKILLNNQTSDLNSIRELIIKNSNIQSQSDDLTKKIDEFNSKQINKISNIKNQLDFLENKKFEQYSEIKRKTMDQQRYSEKYCNIEQKYIKKLSNIKSQSIFIENIYSKPTKVKDVKFIAENLKKLVDNCNVDNFIQNNQCHFNK